jgi:hypothetical protein
MPLDTEHMTLEWRRVEYPIETVQKLMTNVGLPDRLIARLRYGRRPAKQVPAAKGRSTGA